MPSLRLRSTCIMLVLATVMKEAGMLRNGKIIVLAILLALTGCAKKEQSVSAEPFKHPYPIMRKNGQDVTPVLHLKPYQRLIVKGDIDVDILAGKGAHGMRHVGNRAAFRQVESKVENNTLYLNQIETPEPIPADAKSKVVLTIRPNQLRYLKYDGNGKLRATGMDTPRLDVYVSGESDVSLQGRLGLRTLHANDVSAVNISEVHTPKLDLVINDASTVRVAGELNAQKIHLSGAGWLNTYWIKSDNLHIDAEEGAYAQLGGIVDVLVVRLRDKTHLDIRNLRANKSYIKTSEYALAEVWSRDIQSSIASNESNIFYYRDPNFQTAYMAEHGSALNVEGLGEEPPR